MNYIIANWKTYLDYRSAVTLAESLGALNVASNDTTEVVICPPMIALGKISELSAITSGTITLGAQDCFWINEGHVTGEVLPKNIKDISAQYVIIGHSERREQLDETGVTINKKILAAFEAGLNVIVCIGESREERDAGTTDTVITTQLSEALVGTIVPSTLRLLVAYEPIWAINPSTATVDPQDVENRAQVIHDKLESLYGADVVKEHASVIYGGSVSSKDVSNYLALPTISGALIGHASTTADEFAKMVHVVTRNP